MKSQSTKLLIRFLSYFLKWKYLLWVRIFIGGRKGPFIKYLKILLVLLIQFYSHVGRKVVDLVVKIQDKRTKVLCALLCCLQSMVDT